MAECNTNIAELEIDPCDGFTTKDTCIVVGQAYELLNFPENGRLNIFIEALLTKIQDLQNRLEILENE